MTDESSWLTGRGPEMNRRQYMEGTAAVTAGAFGYGGDFERVNQFSDDFLDKVAAGEPVFGVSAALAGMDPITVTSRLDTDWIWVDTEHASYDVREVREMMAVIPEDTAGLVRVPGADPKEVERVLDAGADGVIVPKLRELEEVRAFVESAYYPGFEPDGDRGVAGSPASDFGMEFGRDYMKRANEKAFVVIQVETRELVDRIEAVAKVEGLDCLLIGPADLSSQLGDPLNTDTEEFRRAVGKVLRACKNNDVAPGYWVGGSDVDPFVEDGWQVLSLGSDAGLLAAGVQDRLDRATDGT